VSLVKDRRRSDSDPHVILLDERQLKDRAWMKP
jgi:hypothetical protein